MSSATGFGLEMRAFFGMGVLLGALATALVAQERPVYQPAGAPADPKVPVAWNRYYDHAQATKLLQALTKAFPQRAKLQSLGRSVEGRDMWQMTITNFEVGQEGDKPAFWIDGGIHANEIQSVEVVLYTAWYLLEMDGRSPFVTRLLKERTFYLVPMMSPDSRDAHLYRANSTHSPRTGQRPVDDDRDGLVNEDAPDDLDGDGHIVQMRIKDKFGNLKPHPDYPQMLVPIKEGEQGVYRLLGSEGIDNDQDGQVNEDGDGFYDPNRDWGWNWQPRYVQNGAYRYPFSILENRMVADFVQAHPNIGGAQTYHNTGGMILHGPGAKDDRFDAADLAVYDAIGKKGEMMLPGYKKMNVAAELYEVYGGEIDWLHVMRGAFTFTNELFTPFNLFRKASSGGFFADDLEAHQFNRYLLFDQGFVSWHEFEHPKYGKIEIGGFTKNWLRQPPSFLLEEECHRNMAFTLYHADQLAQVEIADAEVQTLPGGLTQITATIYNSKITPTHSVADLKGKVSPPDLVTLQGPELKVHLALTSDNRFFEPAREQRMRPHEIKLDNIPSRRAIYVRWLADGPGPWEIHVRSQKGGQAQRKLTP